MNGYVFFKNHTRNLTNYWEKLTFQQLRVHLNKLNPSWEIPENVNIEVRGDVPLGPWVVVSFLSVALFVLILVLVKRLFISSI
jgi:hypothetical protein